MFSNVMWAVCFLYLVWHGAYLALVVCECCIVPLLTSVCNGLAAAWRLVAPRRL